MHCENCSSFWLVEWKASQLALMRDLTFDQQTQSIAVLGGRYHLHMRKITLLLHDCLMQSTTYGVLFLKNAVPPSAPLRKAVGDGTGQSADSVDAFRGSLWGVGNGHEHEPHLSLSLYFWGQSCANPWLSGAPHRTELFGRTNFLPGCRATTVRWPEHPAIHSRFSLGRCGVALRQTSTILGI